LCQNQNSGENFYHNSPTVEILGKIRKKEKKRKKKVARKVKLSLTQPKLELA
jgi:hypothetical protein